MKDLTAWETDFETALRKNDIGKVVNLIDSVKYPQLDSHVILDLLNEIQHKLGGQKVLSASIIQDRSLGSLFRRVSVGVRYEKSILCYSVLFAGDDSGWSAGNLDFVDDINKCLTLDWPRGEAPSTMLIKH